MSTLCVMSGVQGSGKSTFVKRHATEYDCVVSRDEIRKEIMDEGEPFSEKKEKIVFNQFTKEINAALATKHFDIVYADATHLTTNSRMKLLRRVHAADRTVCVYMDTPLEICFTQNAKRKRGTEERVPKDVIRKAYSHREIPCVEEGFDQVYIIPWKDCSDE